MSIQTQINRITQNVENTYAVLKALGCDMPEEQSSDNLSATAGTSKVVRYSPQSLTEEQKAQTRTNIGAASEDDLANLPTCNVAYATCETVAATAEKVVTVLGDDKWTLESGRVVMVYFTTSNSASNVTLNVNGTGAYPLWYNNAEYTSTGTAYTGYAKRVINYMFNGTHWVWVGASYDSNTTYKNVSLGHGYVTCATAEATTAKVGTLSSYALTLGGIVAVKFTYAVPANATLNINSKGAKNMFYRGAKITAGVIKAGDIATFIYDGTQYQLMSVDRWQKDIADIIGGTTTVQKAEWANAATYSENSTYSVNAVEATHATTADSASSADSATHAYSADSATHAYSSDKTIEDDEGNIISVVYETKANVASKINAITNKAEEWTFTLEDGSTVTKKVVVA